MKTLIILTTLIIALLFSAAEPVAADPGEAFIEMLFDQKLFTIAFGAFLWFMLAWGVERNKVSSARKRRLKENPELTAEIMKDPKYQFNSKEFWKDELDEILVVSITGVMLIEFDDVLIEYLHVEFGQYTFWERVIYLMSGPVAIWLYKFYQYVRGGGQ